MDRYEHCIVEWVWSTPTNLDPTGFKPTFTIFFAGGQAESHEGGNRELATMFCRLGQEGWRITTAQTATNWILWTLERKRV